MDMLYYVRGMPKLQRTQENYDLSVSKTDQDEDDQFEDAFDESAKIDDFADRMTTKWGAEETQLRTAIYISFVKNSDTLHFRCKIKNARQTFTRLST